MSQPASEDLSLRLAEKGRTGIPAWCMSVVLHALLMGGLIFSVRALPKGLGVEPDRGVGISLVRQSQMEREYFDETTSDANSNEDSVSDSQSLSAALPSDSDLGIDLSGILPSNEGTNFQGAIAVPDAADIGSAVSTDFGPLGSQAKTSIFGIAAEGSKFVYVFDRSTSMLGFNGRPLAAAKRELLNSLDDLAEVHQFQIIFYNDRPEIFQPAGETPSLIWGDPEKKQLAKQFVQGITAFGATRHMDALSLALGMNPDILFFLTDAEKPQLSDDELAKIARLNRGSTIHAIEFGFGPQGTRKGFLAKLAQQNAGQHVYINLAELAK